MFVPNRVGVYGSQYTVVHDPNYEYTAIDVNGINCYHYEMKISKSRLKALDQPAERCDISKREPNTSQCIARYIQDQIGCRMNIYGGKSKADMTSCQLISELEAMKNISRILNEATANAIYELTGCLPSCKRNEFAKIDGTFKTLTEWHGNCYRQPTDLHLEFKVMEASYKEEEQYLIYDFNSFIGGVGGILGLCNLTAIILLGCSVMSIHNQLANLLGRFKTGTKTK